MKTQQLNNRQWSVRYSGGSSFDQWTSTVISVFNESGIDCPFDSDDFLYYFSEHKSPMDLLRMVLSWHRHLDI